MDRDDLYEYSYSSRTITNQVICCAAVPQRISLPFRVHQPTSCILIQQCPNQNRRLPSTSLCLLSPTVLPTTATASAHLRSVASGALACLASVLGKVAFDGETAFHLMATTSCDEHLPVWMPCTMVSARSKRSATVRNPLSQQQRQHVALLVVPCRLVAVDCSSHSPT